jgi:hypothetical protein
MNRKWLAGILFGGWYCFSDEIKQFLSEQLKKISNKLYTKIVIDRRASIMEMPIIDYIFEQCKSKISIKKLHSGSSDFTLVDGIWSCYFQNTLIYCTLTETEIILSISTWNSMTDILSVETKHQRNMVILDDFLKFVEREKMSKQKFLISYFLNHDGWSKPVIRPQQVIKGITPEMQLVSDKITQFYQHPEVYIERGIAYKKGLLLFGDVGTGKTTTVDMLALQFNLDVFEIDLSIDLTDGSLQQFCREIEKPGIVLIDELDKIYEKITNDPQSRLTIGGLLKLVDGRVKLVDGTIIIFIMNRKDVLSKQDLVALTRPGRLEPIEFTTPRIL